MMKVGLIGIGRMGKALAVRLKRYVALTVYDQNRSYAVQFAGEQGVNVAVKMEEFLDSEAVILAVPDQEITTCIKEFNQWGCHSKLLSIATNVTQQLLDETVSSPVACISVKFVGQADEILAGDAPVIVINRYPGELVPVAKKIFDPIGKTLVAQADMVTKINYITAQKVIEAAVKIEEELKTEGYTQDFLLHAAIRQIGVGVLKAYSYHNLGPFGREIEREVRTKLNKD